MVKLGSGVFGQYHRLTDWAGWWDYAACQMTLMKIVNKTRGNAHNKSVLNKIYLLPSNETVRCRFVNEIFNFMFSAPQSLEYVYVNTSYVRWLHKFVNDFPLDSAANGRVYLLHIFHKPSCWWEDGLNRSWGIFGNNMHPRNEIVIVLVCFLTPDVISIRFGGCA